MASFCRNPVGHSDSTAAIAILPTFSTLVYSAILKDMLDPEISVNSFAEQRQQPNAPLLLDVREPWEYQTANLSGALLMPMGEVASRAHQELDPDTPIVVLCHHGTRSLSVTMWLRNQGFDHAQSLAGGIDAWSRTVDPSVPRY